MPSKSRKKMKGQARKAKAKEAAAATNSNRIITTPSNNSILCEHGQRKQRPPDVVIDFTNTFVQSFFVEARLKQCSNKEIISLVSDSLSTTYNNFPGALKKKNNLQFVKENIIFNGTGYLLGEREMSSYGYDQQMALACAVTLMLIDSYDPSTPFPAGTFDGRDAKDYLRNVDIINGCKRSLVKYFVKRTPCKCLDEMYSQLKSTTPKMGTCANCKQRIKRTSMFVCTGCERITYCSKACQLADVPNHQEFCKTWEGYDRDLSHLYYS